MRRFLIVAIAAGVVVVPASLSSSTSRPVRPSAVIDEDEPGWDCRTMGNRICGPSATWSEVSAEVFPGPFVGWNGGQQ